jgi:hypothetical protein
VLQVFFLLYRWPSFSYNGLDVGLEGNSILHAAFAMRLMLSSYLALAELTFAFGRKLRPKKEID